MPSVNANFTFKLHYTQSTLNSYWTSNKCHIQLVTEQILHLPSQSPSPRQRQETSISYLLVHSLRLKTCVGESGCPRSWELGVLSHTSLPTVSKGAHDRRPTSGQHRTWNQACQHGHIKWHLNCYTKCVPTICVFF